MHSLPPHSARAIAQLHDVECLPQRLLAAPAPTLAIGCWRIATTGSWNASSRGRVLEYAINAYLKRFSHIP